MVIDQQGLEQLARNQFKLGADAGVSAGPVGRNSEASTDIQMRAKILSYSRSRGLFAGVTLKGSTIKQDRDANERFYGQPYKTTELVFDRLGGAPDPVPAWRDSAEQPQIEGHGVDRVRGRWVISRRRSLAPDPWTYRPIRPMATAQLDPSTDVILPIYSQNSNISCNSICFANCMNETFVFPFSHQLPHN